MENEKWGVGNAKNEKPFSTQKFHNGEEFELIHGEHPHSRQDNTTYARTKGGSIYGFDGHRIAFKIEIEEYNYLKSSSLSGDEIRKGGEVKVYADGIQIFSTFCRSYERGYKLAERFIESMELHWDWFPKRVQEYIGRKIYYKNHPCKITSFIVSQGCMMIETLDGEPFPIQAWEEDNDYEPETEYKVEVNSENIWWWYEQH